MNEIGFAAAADAAAFTENGLTLGSQCKLACLGNCADITQRVELLGDKCRRWLLLLMMEYGEFLHFFQKAKT